MTKNCGNCLHGKHIKGSTVVVCSMDNMLQTKWKSDSACGKWKELKKKLFGLVRVHK